MPPDSESEAGRSLQGGQGRGRPNPLRDNMLGFIKNLWRKPASAPANEPAPATPTPTAWPGNAEARSATPRRPAAHQTSRGVELPLQPVIEGLPLELRARLLADDVGEATITVPLEKILAQLSRGAVRLSFGELRQLSPGVFRPESDRDAVLVPLPLAEILTRLNPALMIRRRAQRQVQIPAEISSPFDAYGEGTVFSAPPAREALLRHPTPPPAGLPQSSPVTLPPAMGRMAPVEPSLPPPAPATPPVNPPAPIPDQFLPVQRRAPLSPPFAPPAVSQKSDTTSCFTAPPSEALATPPPAEAPIAFAPNPILTAPLSPISPEPSAPPPPLPTGAGSPAGVAAATLQAAGSEGDSAQSEPPLLLMSLSALSDSWPETVRKEIEGHALANAQVAVPTKLLEQGLKQGRITISWQSARSWIQPALPPMASPLDETLLELPLKIVAPAFLARQQRSKGKRVSIDAAIPDLFFGFPTPESTALSVTATPLDTNFYAWGENAGETPAEPDGKSGPSPGTKFVAKYAAPNEVISRAAGLEGVVGALIALPDGLMVASQLPKDLNADTLAAFLPQIFGKVSQCARELRMGELNNLNFTVGNVPWKIFRVNAIFFAAFGKAGKPLPTAQLAALAAELDHKQK